MHQGYSLQHTLLTMYVQLATYTVYSWSYGNEFDLWCLQLCACVTHVPHPSVHTGILSDVVSLKLPPSSCPLLLV